MKLLLTGLLLFGSMSTIAAEVNLFDVELGMSGSSSSAGSAAGAKVNERLSQTCSQMNGQITDYKCKYTDTKGYSSPEGFTTYARATACSIVCTIKD